MDIFNLMPMLNNLLFAMDGTPTHGAAEPVGCDRPPFSTFFPESGLWVINGDRHYAVVGLSKGGTVSLFDKQERRLAARHFGLVAVAGRQRFTTQDHTLNPAVSWTDGGCTASLDVPWKRFGETVFTPWLFLAFRVFNLSLGRLPAVSRALKKALVHLLISRKRRPAIEHRRTIHVDGRTIVVEDEILLPGAVGQLVVPGQFASIHMGSSLYADARSLEQSTATSAWEVNGRVRLRGTLDLSGSRWEIQTLPAEASAPRAGSVHGS
jgi:hypothetical protein